MLAGNRLLGHGRMRGAQLPLLGHVGVDLGLDLRASSAFFLREPRAALTAPMMAGATDTATMPSTMTSKCSCTIGMPPKKYPTSTNKLTHDTPPMTLNSVNFAKFMWPVPAMNGANVRKNGMKRVMTMVRPPYFAKKWSSLAMRSGVSAFTLPESMMRVPKNRAIQ